MKKGKNESDLCILNWSSKLKRCCRNCHFLSNTFVTRDGMPALITRSWTGEERTKCRAEKENSTTNCYKKQWKREGETGSQIESVIKKSRKKCPYFIEYDKEIANFKVIESLRTDRMEVRRSNRERVTLAVAISGWVLALLQLVL